MVECLSISVSYLCWLSCFSMLSYSNRSLTCAVCLLLFFVAFAAVVVVAAAG